MNKNTIRYYAGRFIDWIEGIVDEIYLFVCGKESTIVRMIYGLDMMLIDVADICYFGKIDKG